MTEMYGYVGMISYCWWTKYVAPMWWISHEYQHFNFHNLCRNTRTNFLFTDWQDKVGGALFHRLQSQDSLKNSMQDYIKIIFPCFFSGNLWHHRWAVSQHTELYKSFQSQSAPCSRCSAVGLPTPNFHLTTPGSGSNMVKLESHIFHHSILIDSGVREATFRLWFLFQPFSSDPLIPRNHGIKSLPWSFMPGHSTPWCHRYHHWVSPRQNREIWWILLNLHVTLTTCLVSLGIVDPVFCFGLVMVLCDRGPADICWHLSLAICRSSSLMASGRR